MTESNLIVTCNQPHIGHIFCQWLQELPTTNQSRDEDEGNFCRMFLGSIGCTKLFFEVNTVVYIAKYVAKYYPNYPECCCEVQNYNPVSTINFMRISVTDSHS